MRVLRLINSIRVYQPMNYCFPITYITFGKEMTIITWSHFLCFLKKGVCLIRKKKLYFRFVSSLQSTLLLYVCCCVTGFGFGFALLWRVLFGLGFDFLNHKGSFSHWLRKSGRQCRNEEHRMWSGSIMDADSPSKSSGAGAWSVLECWEDLGRFC